MIFRSSEQDAEINIDGRTYRNGQTDVIKIRRNRNYTVEIKKDGFLDYKKYVYYQGLKFRPQIMSCELIVDEAWQASIPSDYANKDFEVTVNENSTELNAWKLIVQIVTNYQDNLEQQDMNSGYLKTGWQITPFLDKTVRTRIIVKQSSIEPLRYKLKIISEISNQVNDNPKNDENFDEWNRIIRKYNGLYEEFQSRLMN